MYKFYLWPVLIMLGWVALGYAQEPLPPSSLPEAPKGWVDMLVKVSPFVLGALNLYLPDLLVSWMPKLLGKVPPPLIKMIGGIFTVVVSGLNAYGTQEALGHVGGVSPEMAVVQTTAIAGVVAAKPMTNPPDESKKE